MKSFRLRSRWNPKQILDEIFCLATKCEIILTDCEIFCWGKKWNELNPLTPTGISHCEAIFHTRSVFHKSRQGFISIKKAFATASAFFWQGQKDTPVSRAASSSAVASQQHPTRTSELKTVHRTVFFTLLTPLGFKSFFIIHFSINKKPPYWVVSLFMAEHIH